MKKYIFALAAMVLGMGVAVASPSYTNIGVQYLGTAQNGTSGNGWQVAGSLAIPSTPLYLTGSYQRLNVNGNVPAREVDLGGGIHFDLTQNLSLYGEGYGRHLVGLNTQTVVTQTVWGYGADAGVRYQILPAVEIRGGALTEKWTTDTAWKTYATLGASLNVTEALAVTFDGQVRQGQDRQWLVGLQYQF